MRQVIEDSARRVGLHRKKTQPEEDKIGRKKRKENKTEEKKNRVKTD